MADNAWDPQGFQASGGQSVEERQAQPAPQAGGGLMDHWNTFMDHPENRAGLMQFAVNMLSGQGLAGGLGGFAEGAGRNIEAQQAAQREEEAQAIKERETAAKESTAESYGRAVDKPSAAEKPLDTRMLNIRAGLKEQNDWGRWLQQRPDPGDYIYTQMRRNHPEIKNFDDLRFNPQFVNEAREIHKQLHLPEAQRDAYLAQGGGGGASGGQTMPDGSPIYKGGVRMGTWRGGRVIPDAPPE